MKIGKLYQVKEFFWFLYPSKDIASAVDHYDDEAAAYDDEAAAWAAAYAECWSKRFKCNVSYIESNSVFCLLEKDEKYCMILSTNGELGWIILADWCKDDIEEVKI
jgi:hypothetical protein